MTEDDEDKLEVDELYVELKQTFSIYYRLDQYLPGRTKVEMVIEGIKNSRFIIILLSKAYLQQKSEIARLELMYTMNRIKKEFTKCAFIIPLEDNLFIPYKLRHIIKLSKEGASIKLKELARKLLYIDIYIYIAIYILCYCMYSYILICTFIQCHLRRIFFHLKIVNLSMH